MLPIYEERGVYNFYLQVKGPEGIKPAESTSEKSLESLSKEELLKVVQQLQGGAEASSSGFTWQLP